MVCLAFFCVEYVKLFKYRSIFRLQTPTKKNVNSYDNKKTNAIIIVL